MCQTAVEMSSVVLIQPTQLFNLLQQGSMYSSLSDPNYLLLLDTRSKEEYAESHIITAKRAPQDEDKRFVAPYDADLECKLNVILYDKCCCTLHVKDVPVLQYALLLWEMGSQYSIKILQGGFEKFTAFYPFLRTQKIIYMPCELDEIFPYPCEIIPSSLYNGKWIQSITPYITKHLKITAYICCCFEIPEFNTDFLHIPLKDIGGQSVYNYFQTACEFLDSHKNSPVLVFSALGTSRSITIIIAFLMYHVRWSLKEAFNHAICCCNFIRPLQHFLEELSKWEKYLFQEQITDITELV